MPTRFKSRCRLELDHAAFTDNLDATGFIDLAALPAGIFVVGWKAEVSEAFIGDVSAQVKVGVAGSLDSLSAVIGNSCFAIADVASACPLTGAMQLAAITPRVTVTSNADFSSVSAGKMIVTIYYYDLP